MKRCKSILIFAALLFAGFAPQANAEEITPRFSITVDPDQSVVNYFDVYHGETVLFEVTFKRPSNETMTFFWQEQGMGDSYWSERCTTVGDGVYRAVFTPQMDSGAKVFNCFIGRPGMIYRAVFQLRMKQSPGATPGALPLPVKTIDFEQIKVENAPYYTKEQTERVVGSIIGDTVTKEYVENLGISGGGGVDPSELEGKRDVDDLDFENTVFGISINVYLDSVWPHIYEKIYNLREYVVDGIRMWEFDIIGEDKVNSEHIRFGYFDSAYQTNPVGYTIYEDYSKKFGFHILASKSNNYQTSYDKIALKTDIPSWAMEPTPPESMPDNGVTWDGSKLTTKDGTKTVAASDVGAAPSSIAGIAEDALAYASGVFNFMNANTNAWFAGTNYVVGASATTRHKFTFEAGMDLSTVPCSMSLWERRDGEKSAVWDQRDWVSWYWSFKASQMQERINATNEALRAEIAAKAPAAWAKRTAATGLVNPDETTTWIDTKTVTLSPGMAWETVATVDGCGYWTIVGNGATIGGSDKSPLLSIKDFEGNEVLKIKKTASYMAYLNSADFVAGGMRDADGRICFDVRSDVQPVGEFSTTLVNEDFVAEDSDGCPALYEWENIGGGKYRIHFILKPGIVSDACFARFKVEVQGETTVEYSCGQTISGGLIYNGVKIAPVVTQGAAIGTTVTWKVVR